MVKPIDLQLDEFWKCEVVGTPLGRTIERLGEMERRMELKETLGHKMSRDEYLAFVTKTFKEMEELIQRKNADYTNGGGPFANFEQSVDFGVDPFVGLMVRVGDKFQRIKSYCKQGSLQVQNEGVDDALRDLIGYSLIGLGMLHDRKAGSKG